MASTGPKPNHYSHWVMPEPNSGCWLWVGDIGTNGRPGLTRHINKKRKRLNVTRFIWENEKGLIPAGLWVLHKCNIGICVNPEHLYLGHASGQHGRHGSFRHPERTSAHSLPARSYL